MLGTGALISISVGWWFSGGVNAGHTCSKMVPRAVRQERLPNESREELLPKNETRHERFMGKSARGIRMQQVELPDISRKTPQRGIIRQMSWYRGSS